MNAPPQFADLPKLMKTEQPLGLPDDGIERWLIDGQLREARMTVSRRSHGRVEARVSQLLGNWLDQQPEPRGEIYSGRVGCRLQQDPDTTVGIDVVYLSPVLEAQNPSESRLIEGVPTLVVEIQSPPGTLGELQEKVAQYLEVGVPLIWVIDAHFRTVTIYRPGRGPEMVSTNHELSGDPELPGFRVPVASIFTR